MKENRDNLPELIDEAVDRSVDKAFRKYEKKHRRWRFHLKPLIWLIVIVVVACVVGTGVYKIRHPKNTETVSVDGHDLTLTNNGIFGHKVVDFEKPILGEAEQKKLLIVEERSASVNTTVSDNGFLNLGIFSKNQVLTLHGTGTYTVDLTKITSKDISLKDYVLTVKIPHAELHSINFDPTQTEIGDTEHGWLAFGSIQFTAEQMKKFETKGTEQLKAVLGTEDSLSEADRFAKLTVTETLQPIVEEVSPVYRVQVEFQDDDTSNSTSTTSASSSTQSVTESNG